MFNPCSNIFVAEFGEYLRCPSTKSWPHSIVPFEFLAWGYAVQIVSYFGNCVLGDVAGRSMDVFLCGEDVLLEICLIEFENFPSELPIQCFNKIDEKYRIRLKVHYVRSPIPIETIYIYINSRTQI